MRKSRRRRKGAIDVYEGCENEKTHNISPVRKGNQHSHLRHALAWHGALRLGRHGRVERIGGVLRSSSGVTGARP